MYMKGIVLGSVHLIGGECVTQGGRDSEWSPNSSLGFIHKRVARWHVLVLVRVRHNVSASTASQAVTDKSAAKLLHSSPESRLRPSAECRAPATAVHFVRLID
jgi:hypothetical protein